MKKSELIILIKECIKEGKKDYKIYHDSYSSTIDTVVEYPGLFGYTIKDDDVWNKISIGPKKPNNGQTNKISLPLYKNDKEQRKMLHIQIYGMNNRYELNMYIQ